jgi:hypothetical protein
MLNIILLQLWQPAPFEPWLPSRESFSERINGGLALSRGHAKSSRVDPESPRGRRRGLTPAERLTNARRGATRRYSLGEQTQMSVSHARLLRGLWPILLGATLSRAEGRSRDTAPLRDRPTFETGLSGFGTPNPLNDGVLGQPALLRPS